MQTYITSKEELIKVIQESVDRSLMNLMPDAIKKSLRNKWLTTNEVMMILQCSRRHVQHLRDTHQISYSKNKQTIRYDVDEIDRYMVNHEIDHKGRSIEAPPF